MTKVIWAGYMGQDPQFGQFLGFAIGEFLVIALFWHAIFSFIIPLFVFQILGSTHHRIVRTTRRLVVCVLIVVLASIFIPTGLMFDLGGTLVSIVSNGLLLVIALAVSRHRHPHGFTLESLRLGKRGLGIAGAYILFLYVFLLIVLLPERIAPPLTLILTGLFYLLVIAMFYFSKEKEMVPDIEPEGPVFSRLQILGGFLAIFLMSILWVFLYPIAGTLGIFLYLGMVMAGPALFILALYRVLARRL